MSVGALHLINVYVHIALGVAALAAGLLPLVTVKGSRVHRGWGRAFVFLGVGVLGTALIGIAFFDPPAPLVAAAVAAGYQFIGGLRALQRRAIGPGALDAVLALACLALCATLLMTMGSGTRSWTPAIGYSTLGFVSFIALYDLSRFFWRERWMRGVWRYDHGLKLTGSFFAMMSAGVGNVFRDLQPWSQVGPSAVGVLVMILVAVMFGLREGKAAA